MNSKTCILFVLLVAMLHLGGCYHEGRYEYFFNYSGRGEVTAYLNGMPWEGHGSAIRDKHDKDYLRNISFSERKIYEQVFATVSISCPILLHKGIYELNQSTCPIVSPSSQTIRVLFGFIEVDAVLYTYDLIVLEDMPNLFSIKDIKGDWIHGEFQLAFKKRVTPFQPENNYPDTLLITDGLYSIQVFEAD